ncbi:hypothetical protein [Burkholderia pseudomallei]|uniref:hypothetical protein n=1 Tax=Burkholderia pseudomallei TaxID=28450 RepID=UPI00065A8A3C|nr:hypothetical protein [Burkholderia pseudomallei]CRY14659.1 UDP-glucose 4-epimerase [Burkholderia pseudomallei]
MTLSGNIKDGDWTVEVTTSPVQGGYVCDIEVMHGAPGGAFRHAFRHGGTYPAEHDAMIEGLRAGMTWIELKMSKAFNL